MGTPWGALTYSIEEMSIWIAAFLILGKVLFDLWQVLHLYASDSHPYQWPDRLGSKPTANESEEEVTYSGYGGTVCLGISC